MKSTNNKLISLLGSIVIALSITMFLPSLANAKGGYNHGSKNHTSKNHTSKNHASKNNSTIDCTNYKAEADKYKKLADKYLAKYYYTHCYSYYRYYLCYIKKYEYFKKKFDQCQSSDTVDCNQYKVLADKYKACALHYKTYADKYLAKYNQCHWYCYYRYYLYYTKKYNYYMDLYNQYMDKYNNCQIQNIYGSVVGYIYNDVDKNHRKDDEEIGTEGVHVSLTDDDGEIYDDAITDATGKYTFDKVHEGEVTITVTNNGLSDGELYTINNPQTLTVEAGKENNAKNVGYTLLTPVGTLSGKVFEDSNEDGVFTDGEVGASGILITITDSEMNTQHVTSQDGTYSFSNVAEGSVDIVISSLPTGYILIEGSNLSFSADITPNQNNIADNTGYTLLLPVGSIHGRVLLEGVGGSGIKLNIIDSNGTIHSVETHENGNWALIGIPVGDYIVDVDERTLPEEYIRSIGIDRDVFTILENQDINAGIDGFIPDIP